MAAAESFRRSLSTGVSSWVCDKGKLCLGLDEIIIFWIAVIFEITVRWGNFATRIIFRNGGELHLTLHLTSSELILHLTLHLTLHLRVNPN